MMNEIDNELRAFLNEFEAQPALVRQVLIYVICETMLQKGQLQLLGVFPEAIEGTSLLYRNPLSGDVFEILKPKMTDDEEHAVRARITELLQEGVSTAA